MAKKLQQDEDQLHWVQCDKCSKWRASRNYQDVTQQVDAQAWTCTDGGLSCEDAEVQWEEMGLEQDMSVKDALVIAIDEVRAQTDLGQPLIFGYCSILKKKGFNVNGKIIDERTMRSQGRSLKGALTSKRETTV